MRLGWSDLRRTVRRRNGLAHVYPTYLHDERRLPQLGLAIGYFESLLGRPRAEFESDLPKIINAMDQPSIDGVNTWFVAKAARERGLKVAISGLGGDELLGG